jgi:hypothetical protein
MAAQHVDAVASSDDGTSGKHLRFGWTMRQMTMSALNATHFQYFQKVKELVAKHQDKPLEHVITLYVAFKNNPNATVRQWAEVNHGCPDDELDWNTVQTFKPIDNKGLFFVPYGIKTWMLLCLRPSFPKLQRTTTF